MGTNEKRRAVEWGKNLLIAALSISAIFLISQSGLYEPAERGSGGGEGRPSTSSPSPGRVDEDSMSIQMVRLAIQNEEGRYGVHYDEEEVNYQYTSKLGRPLSNALAEAVNVRSVSEEEWQQVLQGDNLWIYYNFMSDLPLTYLSDWFGNEENTELSGFASSFLLAEVGQAPLLYYHCFQDGAYYCMDLPETILFSFRSVLSEYTSDFNEVIFAFEDPQNYPLDPNMMIVPGMTDVTSYEAQNPLDFLSLTEGELQVLLRALEFNPQTSSAIPRSDGRMIQETASTDRLEIKNNGTIVYRDGEQVRYPVIGDDWESMVETVQSLLKSVLLDRYGDANVYLIDVEAREDGAYEVSFGYCLNGAKVRLFGEDRAAWFVISNGVISEYTIHVRQYSKTEDLLAVLPEKQAAAAAAVMGQQGKKLLLSYVEYGESITGVEWMPY